MKNRELLISGAEQLGLPLSTEQVDVLFRYVAELKKWNRKINLTAVREEREIVIKHLLDSLAFAKGFSPGPGLTLMDIGSGAGFPALPLRIVFSGIAVTLVESVKKKASFLRHIVRTLNLERVKVLDERAEALSETMRESYDVVTARAFAQMDKALAAGAPFLKKGGRLILSRGPEEGVTEAAVGKSGLAVAKVIPFTLPHSSYGRAIWIFKKPE
ncbi:MAG: 16S rRNA (guanine(527)-N(7))-methyltransferase RsmG [Nitrospirae bacterium GWC2_57_13]|nr:MAG: 16S rRNA (guanine(527)-N(7))-methyltransferase RsmG [Nitrospirae bacterium GWC1_57_7]OGW27361.1 MAG: 16S rRNA (guanine(527)-N(7))-methyltransferase RsmG [Nitrospirae bacterium GWC2_57_13]HAR46846.1 16S rRNA (guanine(527)-N(7))-methyltransferase RsmG [Nitrospiraceae bacterium]HAS54125.1 16S rRNA (guanine(527)-N(7))-methyltransferase RsmG [Nitrospiraceae bacterium]